MDILKKAYAPLILTLIGLAFVIYGFANTQPGLFMLGAAVWTIVGIIATLSALDVFNKTTRMGILAGLVILSLVLTWLDYKAIADPLDFNKEKNRRYAYVIQNLKDLRQAELAYKARYGNYVGNIDTLVDFINNDSVFVIKSIGTVPDGLTKQQAIDSNYLSIDTLMVPANLSIFNSKYLLDRKVPFNLDSLAYVPFSNGVMFNVESNVIVRNGVKVPVFLITDAAPFDKQDVLMVGSLTDPTTAGNWGE